MPEISRRAVLRMGGASLLTPFILNSCSKNLATPPRNEEEFLQLRSDLFAARLSAIDSKFTKKDAPLVIVITDHHQNVTNSIQKIDLLERIAPAGVIGLEGLSFSPQDSRAIEGINKRASALLGTQIDLFAGETTFEQFNQHAQVDQTPHLGIEKEATVIKTRILSTAIRSLDALPRMIRPIGDFLPLYDQNKNPLLDAKSTSDLEAMLKYLKSAIPNLGEGRANLQSDSVQDAVGSTFFGIDRKNYTELKDFLFKALIKDISERNKGMVDNLNSEMQKGKYGIAYIVVGFGHAQENQHKDLPPYTILQRYLESAGMNYIVLDNTHAQESIKPK